MGSYHRIKVLENSEVSERFLPTLNATSCPGWLHDFAPSPSLEIVVLCQPVNYDFLQSWQDTRWSYFQNQKFTYCFNVPKKSNHLHLHDVRKIYLIDSRKSVMMRMSNLPFASCVASASICSWDPSDLGILGTLLDYSKTLQKILHSRFNSKVHTNSVRQRIVYNMVKVLLEDNIHFKHSHTSRQ